MHVCGAHSVNINQMAVFYLMADGSLFIYPIMQGCQIAIVKTATYKGNGFGTLTVDDMVTWMMGYKDDLPVIEWPKGFPSIHPV